MNQGISQAFSYLLYAIMASALFAIVVALFGGGYHIGKTSDNTTKFYYDSEAAEIVNHTEETEVDSIWEQFGSNLHR